jgi:hypothetical protein
MIAIVCALNFIALAVNISLPSRAAIGGLNYEDVMHDSDFIRAVKSTAEGCMVNVNILKLKC